MVAHRNGNRLTDSGTEETLADVFRTCQSFTRRTVEQEAAWQRAEAAFVAKLAQRERDDRIGRLAKELGPRYTPELATLDTYRTYHAAQKPVVKRLQALAERLDEITAAGSGLVLFGSVGTGKDHLAAALLYRIAETTPTSWVNGRDVFGESRDRIKEERVEREMLASLCDPTVLCISDPVPIIGPQSAWNIDLLYRVLDRRYHLLRPTWMTLNVRDAADAEERLTPPVWDRLRDGAELVACFWPSYRRERRQ